MGYRGYRRSWNGWKPFWAQKRRRTGQRAHLFADVARYWKINDAQVLRNEEMEFIRAEWLKKYGHDDHYGVSCNQGNHYLRRLHNDGKLRVLADRESRPSLLWFSIKPCTYLVTLGVLLLPFDLSQASALLLGHNSFDDMSTICRIVSRRRNWMVHTIAPSVFETGV